MINASLKIAAFCLLPAIVFGQTGNVNNNKYQPLIDAAQKTNSDALLVLKDGATVAEYYSNEKKQKIQSMSVTKSVVGLAMAKLLTEGKIDSLDMPVAHFYPEWRQGQKDEITIRHLMNQTSGLQNVANANVEVNPAPDVLQLGLCASVVNKPGTEFSYNNKAVNILSGIIRQAAGQPVDEYLQSNLFNSLNITDFNWGTDDSGNHLAMSGLSMHARDFAKLGQLVLQEGSWKGNQLIDEKRVEQMLAPGSSETSTYGLLWWRIPKKEQYLISKQQIEKMEETGLADSMVTKVKHIQGEYDSQGSLIKAYRNQFESRKELWEFRKATMGNGVKPYTKSVEGPAIGYKASGDGGQYIIIYPKQEIVAVRMVDTSASFNRKTDTFPNFPKAVYKVISSP